MAINYQNNRPQNGNPTWKNGPGGNAPVVPKPAVADRLPENFVDQAERVIRYLFDLERADKKNKHITSTKIRKLFGLFTDLYNAIRRDSTEELKNEYLQGLATARIRLVYECGRVGKDADVSTFVSTAKLLEYLKQIGSSRQEFMRFHQYFEALVAYHRYTFGDDKNQ